MNLNLSEEQIWSTEIHSKHKNVIRKAQSYNLKFVVDYHFKYKNNFIELYNNTMNKINAEKYYFFEKNYYKKLEDLLHDNFFHGFVTYQDKIIASSIFLYNNKYGHYHLSGSNEKYLHLYPNNFLIYEAAIFLKKMGCIFFHLGGGSNKEKNNSLYKFKQRFSKNNYQFYIGKIIVNQIKYNELCSIWDTKFPDKKDSYSKILLRYRY